MQQWTSEPIILVVGSNGYIGRHVCLHLLQTGQKFVPVDVQESSIDSLENYRTIDLLDKETYAALLSTVSHVLLLSGRTGTYDGFLNYPSYLELNELALLNVLDVVRSNSLKVKLLFPSTRLVYKGQKDTPLSEDAEKQFLSIYAINKNACEQYLQLYHRQFGIHFVVTRICLPYGSEFSGPQSYGTLSFFTSLALQGKNISIFGDGSQKRSLVHIADLAQVLVQCLLSDRTDNGIFNVGGPDTYSIAQIAESVARTFGVSVEHTEWPPEQFLMESGDTIFDSSRLDSILSIEYKHSFTSWLDSLRGRNDC